MNKESILGVARHILTFGGGFLTTNGAISASELEIVIGALITIGGVVWSIFDKRTAK